VQERSQELSVSRNLQIIETDNLVTLFVAVPIFSKKDWLKSYETLAHFVVPRSSK
jgi:V-type H+-transporting ATPase subunit C|tara:strand:+ start:1297 stop:1461 length:165 start_codon:yes stop_codon:yes gene_type:complete